MDTPGRAIDNGRDTLYVRFPLAIAASVGVTDLDAKRNAFAAILTFSHLLHLLVCLIMMLMMN